MAGNHTEVFGIYSSDVQAGLAVVRLMESGFPNDDISVLRQDHRSSETVARNGAKTPDSSATPTTADRTFGFLGESNALAIPGGQFVAIGPIRATLAKVGGGGGLTGGLVDIGIVEVEARRYEEKLKAGGVLLSVRCDSSVSVTRAKNLLKQMGGQDIASSGDAGAAHGAAPQDGPGARV